MAPGFNYSPRHFHFSELQRIYSFFLFVKVTRQQARSFRRKPRDRLNRFLRKRGALCGRGARKKDGGLKRGGV